MKHLRLGLLITALMTGLPGLAQAQDTSACYGSYKGQDMLMMSSELVNCAKAIKGSQSGSTVATGRWGNNAISVDSRDVIFLNGQVVGRLPPQTGSYRTLQASCRGGDVMACDRQSAIEDYSRLFPAKN